MNHELWHKILAFDPDQPWAEYGFSIRLASENGWTKSFTRLAILEYKKFMYLAATAGCMVSPSETVDRVWHQHLIFSRSYHDFCNLLGRQIEHMPSTHNRNEYQQFKEAKERTRLCYEQHFGPQPADIWQYNHMLGSLNMKPAKVHIRAFIVAGIACCLALLFPAYKLLMPVYTSIDNPYFLFGLLGLAALVFIILEALNRSSLKRIVNAFHPDSFIYKLQPYELIYLKTQKLSYVIHGAVHELAKSHAIRIHADKTLDTWGYASAGSDEQQQLITTLNELGATHYPRLLRTMIRKPVFRNIARSMDHVRKHIMQSKIFGRLFYLNFSVLALLILFASARILTGISREKPVMLIVLATIGLILLSVAYLRRLCRLPATRTIPDIYRTDMQPGQQAGNNWQWQYFLLGMAAMSPSFLPLPRYTDRHHGSSSGSDSACGSSCESSCSSCGGCGGD